MKKLLWAFTALSTAAFGQFEIYLKEPNKIPLYAQETNVWCGAASAQMMLEGFPHGVKHAFKQKEIWDTIQGMKVETSWYTDPDGLKNVMDRLGGDSHWAVTCSKTADPLMKFVIRNLSDRKYPTSVLVYGDAHWIVVIGATLDTDPSVAETVKLEKIEAHDPWKAQHVLVSGTTWYQKYWNGPARRRGKWNGCYVAVYENTQTSQMDYELQVTRSAQTESYLSSEEIAEKAVQYLKKLAVDHADFAALNSRRGFPPILVTHPSGSYYLVALGNPASRIADGALMLNAESGDWEGVVRFAKPIRHFDTKKVRGEWIFTPSEESRSPFLPVFKVASEEKPQYLDFEGNRFNELHPLLGN